MKRILKFTFALLALGVIFSGPTQAAPTPEMYCLDWSECITDCFLYCWGQEPAIPVFATCCHNSQCTCLCCGEIGPLPEDCDWSESNCEGMGGDRILPSNKVVKPIKK